LHGVKVKQIDRQPIPFCPIIPANYAGQMAGLFVGFRLLVV
jgi:hypothetical protein